ncbi:MAG: ParB/RepB/Spo0J family partition protein [Planctomycetota bacterium]
MANSIESIALDKLVAHPDNPNRQSKLNFARLLRNIERTGRYEPLVVRPCPAKAGFYQIINGHHRHNALAKLGCKTADCIVWDMNDEQTDILLATLNRLGGSDVLAKKLKLLERLNKKMGSTELAKLVPQTRRQIERLANLKLPSAPARMNAQSLANPLVFFLTDEQQRVVEKALLLAEQSQQEKTKAARKAAALNRVARHFLNNSMTNSGSPE